MSFSVRAVVFDAVGTLIHAEPRVAKAYGDIGRRYGSRFDDIVVAERFAIAFQRQENLDRERAWITSEAREYERWRAIVAEVLSDADFEPCFRELYAHFAQPSAWRVSPWGVLASLPNVTIASNFDSRLHGIVAGIPELRSIERIIVSSEIGVRKPGWGFFAAIEERLGIPAAEILYIGDEPINDGEGAAAAGMRSLLVGRDVHSMDDVKRLLG